MQKDLAPIVLFVYNRPDHTLRTLKALKRNKLADQSLLYIYCDGPKENISVFELQNLNALRTLIKQEQWCKEVIIKEYERNLGLANSIIKGVTDVVNKYGKAIVLEDDIETSHGFLKYMNEALQLYEQDTSVMHISGYMFPVKQTLPSTFFYNTCSCWGWATWKRAWSMLNADANDLYSKLKETNLLNKFNIEGSADFEKQLLDNLNGKCSTWAIKWYATLFLNNGFSLHPYPSLTNNIGHDSSGENCGIESKYNWQELAHEIPVFRIPIKESRKARHAMVNFYKTDHRSFLEKIKNHIPLKSKIKKIVVQRERSQLLKKILSQIELKRIRKKPRFTELKTGILGKGILIPDSASFVFMFKEIFFEQIYRFISSVDDPLIIDCGANIGLSAIYFKQLYPNAKIIAFEPDQKIFSFLKKNVESFKYQNIQLINKGLWSYEGKVVFKSEGADGGHIDFSSKNSNTSIDVTRLSAFLDEKVEFLKIDIEGAEITVLEECRYKLNNVKHLFIEYHSFINEEQHLDKLFEILKSNNFRTYISTPGLHSKNPFVEVNTYNGMDLQLNIFGVKK